jgi:hypothetical protein
MIAACGDTGGEHMRAAFVRALANPTERLPEALRD